MQLSNICRDVGEDARTGRLYLPRDWMREEGLDPDAFLIAPRHSRALGRVVERVLARAEALYERALPGIAALPGDCRPAIRAARLLYREIGRRVAANRLDAVTSRAVVPTARKLALLADAAARAPAGDPAALAAAPLGAVRFLMEAVETATAQPRTAVRDADRVTRAMDIFVIASLNVSATRVRRLRGGVA
jgi:phytoene synthase